MIEILDTTLRDGMQGHGTTYSVEDKLQAISALRRLGVHLIELGNPSASAIDRQVAKIAVGDDLVLFGATRRKDCPCEDDCDLQYLAISKIKNIAIFGKASAAQALAVLKISPQDNLQLIKDSVLYLVRRGKNVIFDAEHFFDGYMQNAEYALSALKVAFDCGATRLILCDTNGATMLKNIVAATADVVKTFPQAIIGIHCHNDCGIAVAQTMAAVESGATHVQGTLLGSGERCGNTCLSTLIPNLALKYGMDILPDNSLKQLYSVSRQIAELSNATVDENLPYIGENAFAHKAGMHCDAVLKSSQSFEHCPPESVGNHNKIIVSVLSGKANIAAKLAELFPSKSPTAEDTKNILKLIKQKETDGYSYELCEASFYLLCLNYFNGAKSFFKLIDYTVSSSASAPNVAELKLLVGEKISQAKCLGVGPVNALDQALRQALMDYYPQLRKVTLIDYKVRVIDSDSATSAKVRVIITSTDGNSVWSTVGVSEDIIKASLQALEESVDYLLSHS